MSDVSVRKALETKLDALTPSLATAWENLDFAPTAGTPYQKAHLLPAEPENPCQGASFKRLSGLLQVTLMYPQGVGPGDAVTRAQLLRDWFPRNLSLVADGITVTIDKTPYVMSGFADGDRWAVPVRIPYFANISS